MKRVMCFVMSFLLLILSLPIEGLAGSVSGNEGVEKSNSSIIEKHVSQNKIGDKNVLVEVAEGNTTEDISDEILEQSRTSVISNPIHCCTKDSDVTGKTDSTTWSYIYFGTYPQSEVTDSATITTIDSAISESAEKTEVGADVWVNGIKYRRISKADTNNDSNFGDSTYRYFKWELIKWRVLNNNGSTLFVVADTALDCKTYHDYTENMSWENSNIRNWLNESFYNTAFSSSEQEAIVAQNIANNDNPEYGSEGGNSTNDKVYLLSIEEASNNAYGFCSAYQTNSASRRLQASEYANARGVWRSSSSDYEGNCWWLLRSPGTDSSSVANIFFTGYVDNTGDSIDINDNGIAPALHVKLSSDSWINADAGTDEDSSEGDTDEEDNGSTETPFNLYMYRADYLNNLLNPSSAAWNKNLNADGICEQLTNELEQTNFKTASQAWTVLQNTFKTIDNAGEAIDIVMKERDMYEAMVLDVLSSASKASLIDKEQKKIISDTKKIVSLIKTSAETDATLDFIWDLENHRVKWSSLSSDQQQKVMKVIEDYFKESNPKLTQINKFFKNVDIIIKAVDDVEKCINYIVSYVNLYQMSEAQKAAIQKLYDECPESNKEMKQALRECLTIITSSNLEFVAQMTTGSCQIVGKDLVSAWIGVYWDDVKSTIISQRPELMAIMFSYKASTYISNVLFNTDETVERYFNMAAMKELRSIAGDAYNALKADYKNEKNEWNAEVYLSGADLLYRAMDADCEYGQKYVEALDQAAMTKLNKLWGDTDTEDALDAIKTIQSSYKLNYYSTLTAWIYDLELDYPEEYPKYKDLIDSTWGEFEKSYEIACPVDIYIYDKNNQLVASVIDNVPQVSNDTLTIAVKDDVKTVYFTEESDSYTIKYVGTDEGTMDIKINEYQEGETVRTVLFNQLELKDELEYTSDVTTAVLSDELYQMTKGTDEIISSDYDSFVNDSEKTHKVTIVNGMGYQNETPSVTIEAKEGERISIGALVEDSGEFQNWTVSESSTVIKDTKATYTDVYVGTSDCIITAVLKDNSADIGNTEEESGEEKQEEKAEEKVEESPVGDSKENQSYDKDVKKEKNESTTQAIKVSSLSITAPSKKLVAGKKVKLSAQVTPSNATNSAVTWQTSNTKYATINQSGKLTLKKAGAGKTVTLTATAADGSGVKATYKIKIMKHAVKSIKLSATSKSVKAGKSIKLRATIKTTGKKVNKTLKWTSSNTKYATVTKSGKVKTKKAGKGKNVKITAQATDGTGKKASIKMKLK